MSELENGFVNSMETELVSIMKRYSLNMKNTRILYSTSKRILDIVLSLLSIILLSPILLIVVVAIRFESKGNVIFSQKRIGKNGHHFNMYKFRSMVQNAEDLKSGLLTKNEMDGPMFKMKDDPRITKIGKFIRKTSIDELPQLINILKGEMSVVGPRPSLPSEVAKFESWMLRRLHVKPGLTCFWQVSGRNSLSFEEWMKLDIRYVQRRGFFLDLNLILKTFRVLLGDKNAS